MDLAFIVYNIMLLALCYIASFICNDKINTEGRALAAVLFILTYTVVFGLRYRVGGDFYGYERYYKDIQAGSMPSDVPIEFGFYFINYVLVQFGFAAQSIFIATCFLQSFLLVAIIWETKRAGSYIAYFYFATLFLFESFNLIRQALSVTLVYYSFIAARRLSIKSAFLLCIAAATIHVSSVIALPFLFFRKVLFNNNRAGLLFLVLVFYLMSNYIAEYILGSFNSTLAAGGLLSYSTVQDELFVDTSNLGGAGVFLGLLVDLCVISLIAKTDIYQNNYSFRKLYNMYLLGVLMFPILNSINYLTISRIFYIFETTRFIMLGVVIHYMISGSDRKLYFVVGAFFLVIYFIFFNNAIANSAAWCSPYQFISI